MPRTPVILRALQEGLQKTLTARHALGLEI